MSDAELLPKSDPIFVSTARKDGFTLISDFTFEAAFRRLFVYNILFEDAEVDGQYFDIQPDSKVLGISAAGCGLASMVRFQPRHIDAVDINGHHLALASLKMKAARDLSSYGLLYDLFGHGWVTKPEDIVRRLVSGLPTWLEKYWKRHYGRFDRSLYQQGLTAWMLGQLRRHMGMGTAWMHDFVQMSREERMETVRALTEPVLRKPHVSGLLKSPLQQLALGVNFSQKDRMLQEGDNDIVDFIIRHLQRVAGTDVETNWFAWYAAAGHYNHDHPEAVPPYLRRKSHETSKQAPTSFGFHHRSIFNVLEDAQPNTWTHYSLCDAVDWMPREVQLRLLNEILRTALPGAMVLMRSVDNKNIVEECGLEKRFRHLAPQSRQASLDERSCQYQRVDFFQVLQ